MGVLDFLGRWSGILSKSRLREPESYVSVVSASIPELSSCPEFFPVKD